MVGLHVEDDDIFDERKQLDERGLEMVTRVTRSIRLLRGDKAPPTTMKEVEAVLDGARSVADEFFGTREGEANRWAGDFDLCLVVTDRDTKLLESCGNDLVEAARRVQQRQASERISVRRIKKLCTQDVQQALGEEFRNDVVLLKEIARDGIKIFTSADFVPSGGPIRLGIMYEKVHRAVDKHAWESWRDELVLIIPTERIMTFASEC